MLDRLRGLGLWLVRLLGGSRRDAELEEELRFHIERETEAGIERGLARKEARRRALVKFGGVERHKEALRDQRRLGRLADFWRDLGGAVRLLGRHRVFAAAAVLTLALGLGGLVAGYGLVHGVLLRPLPYPESDRLVSVWQTLPGWDRFPASYPIYDVWSRESGTLAGLAAYDDARLWLGEGVTLERVDGAPSTSTLPAVLRVAPRLGRWFTEAEDRSGARVAVVSHGFWRSRLAGDPGVLGSSITLDDERHTVIGVMPEGFRFPTPETAVWLPLGPEAREAGWNSQFLAVVGRLGPDVTAAAADDEVEAITARVVAAGNGPDVGTRVVTRHDDVTGDVRATLTLVFAALGAVLLIGFLNVTNLFLARRAASSRALAVRSALGASRSRLRQQRVAEGLVVATLGAAVGLGLAALVLEALTSQLPWRLPRLWAVRLDAPVILFAAGVTAVLGVALGWIGSVGSLRGGPGQLGAGGRHTAGRSVRWLRGLMVAVQVAAVFALLTGATLLLRSLDTLLGEEPGFDAAGVVTLVEPAPPESRYADDRARGELFDRVVDRLRATPGVESVALVLPLPFSGSDETGSVVPPDGDTLGTAVIQTGADYFDALRIPIIDGRPFTADEVSRVDAVAVVNRTLAGRLGRDPVGTRLDVGGRLMEVVGVAADVRHGGLARDPGSQVYVPYLGTPDEALSVVARVAGDAGAMVPTVRTVLAEVEPALAAEPVVTLERLVRSSAAAPRFRAVLLLVIGLAAALLAAVGLWGVTALTMAERTRETAIRVTLGARPRRAAFSAVGREMLMVAGGLLAGAGGAVALAHALRGFLYEVTPLDPASFGLTAVGVLAIALMATAVPALRAARGSPTEALKPE